MSVDAFKDSLINLLENTGLSIRVATIIDYNADSGKLEVEMGENTYYCNNKVSESDDILINPVINSNVIVGLINNDVNNMIILRYEEIEFLGINNIVNVYKDKVELKTNKLSLLLGSDNKVELKNDVVNLKEILSDMKDLLDKITNTPIAPNANIKAGNVSIATDINSINTKINNLLK